MRIGSLFSGIGGLELGLEWSGLGHTVWQVEQKPFCLEVLEKRWPSVERFEDVREAGKHNLESVDIICGGFPCQDISSAGKGEGLAGSRSGLWFEFARIVGEIRPEWVVVENVASGAKRWVDQVCAGLEQRGYETLPIPLSAEDVGAPHRRERIFVVAHAHGARLEVGKVESVGEEQPPTGRMGEARDATYAHRNGESTSAQYAQMAWLHETTGDGGWEWRPPVSPVCGMADGVPYRLDRLKALGNSVVPQCAEVIGHVIQELMVQR